MKTRYLAPNAIERQAEQLIGAYEQQYGFIYAPVPVERIAENLLDLILEWNKIPEGPNEVIFAGLNPRQKKIVFNEKRKNYYEDTDGLYNTVLAHEIGHWVLHVDATDLGLQPTLPGTGVASEFVYRSTGPANTREWQAHSFMGYLLLPSRLLRNYIETDDIYDWKGLYEMKEKFDVTISALIVRLQKMGLIFIDDDKSIYPSEAVSKGQSRLV